MTDRLSIALAIRDRVLTLMEGNSTMHEAAGIRIQMWKGKRFTATLNTPFNPMPNDALPNTHKKAVAQQRAVRPMPYQLSLWRTGQKKVLSIEWDGDHSARVVSFKRGDWEAEILT